MAYRVSSRTSRAIQKNPVSKNKTKAKAERKKKGREEGRKEEKNESLLKFL